MAFPMGATCAKKLPRRYVSSSRDRAHGLSSKYLIVTNVRNIPPLHQFPRPGIPHSIHPYEIAHDEIERARRNRA